MPSQKDFTFDVPLETDPEAQGGLHTLNYEDESQRELFTQRGVQSGFFVRITLGTVLHGYIEIERKRVPASLITLNFQFQSPPEHEHRKFVKARMDFKFENHPKAEPTHDPCIVSFSPGSTTPVTLNPRAVQKTN